jgi:DNA-binding transcriptional LysR family regulator
MFFSRQIIQFIIAVQEGSLLKAAEKISITPSAMSRGIGELEYKLGSKLIKRARHGIQPTEKGERLYRKLISHYNEIERFTNEFKKSIGNHDITIKTDGLYMPKVKEKILQLLKENNDIKISFLPGCNDSPENIFSDGLVDIYISTCNRPIKNTNLISMKPELIGIMAHKNIIHEHKNVKDMLSKKPIIQTHSALKHDLFQSLKNRLIQEGFEVNILPVTDIADVCYLVNEGAGISFMPHDMHCNNGLSDLINFIEKPLDSPIILQRYIHFKSEEFKKLIHVCSILGEL